VKKISSHPNSLSIFRRSNKAKNARGVDWFLIESNSLFSQKNSRVPATGNVSFWQQKHKRGRSLRRLSGTEEGMPQRRKSSREQRLPKVFKEHLCRVRLPRGENSEAELKDPLKFFNW